MTALGPVEVFVDAADTFLSLSGLASAADIDTNGDVLVLTALSNNPGLVTANVAGNALTLDYTSGQFGSAQITVRAKDSFGLFDEASFDVTVTAQLTGSASGTSTVPILISPNVYTLTGSGTFSSTFLGTGTYTGSSTQDWNGATFPDNPCAVVDATVTLTTVNGTLTGVINPAVSTLCSLPPFDSLAFELVLHITFTGGTGDFLNASGSLISTSSHVRSAVDQPSSDNSVWVGTIS